MKPITPVRPLPSATRPLLGTVVGAALLLLAPMAQAKEGGGSGCPWAQDVSLTLDRETITLPQAIFNPSTPTANVDGYELDVDHKTLSLRVTGPRGHIWQAALTHLASGKRCKAFYVGRPTLVFDPLGEDPANRVARK